MTSTTTSTLRRGPFGLAVLIVLLCWTSSTSHAEIITFKFSGVLDSVSGSLALPITPNTPFTGLYRFNSTTPDQSPDSLDLGSYRIPDLSITLMGSPSSLFLQGVGDLNVEHLVHTSINGSFYDRYYLAASLRDEPLHDLNWVQFGLGLLQFDRGLFQDKSLPLTPPSLSALDSNIVSFDFSKGYIDGPEGFPIPVERTQAVGHLTSLSLAPVPLPGAIILFGSSLLGFAGFELRRRRASRTQ